jgi:hypothetical protein
MYESTPQHIIDEESAPGPVAAWMESSDDGMSTHHPNVLSSLDIQDRASLPLPVTCVKMT